jgi:squalene-hopene/tetraprenyl-beta-curcumene cyclase
LTRAVRLSDTAAVKTLLLVAAGAWLAAAAHGAPAWNAQAAADYLDGRQQQWSEWPRAQSANGPCVSCHTGMTYLVARPALRRVLRQTEPTKYETALLNRLRSNVGAKPAAALRDVEVIFAALFLAAADAGQKTLSPDTQKAFDQLWALQLQEGDGRGAWKWYQANLDPWEMAESTYYGASLAALAVGLTPADYRQGPGVRANIDQLVHYLQAGMTAQPLHNRVALVWASSRLKDLLSTSARQTLIDEIFRSQAADGGWSIQSLGPWQSHANAPAAAGSSSYATGFVAYVLQQASEIDPSDRRLQRALDWLRAHQDPGSGSWPSVSMNKSYPDGSMEQSFMRDAATAFAAAALAR